MSKNNKDLPEYHFVATEIDFKVKTETRKILAGKWCHNYSNLKNFEADNIEIMDDVWNDTNLKETDYKLAYDIRNKYSEQISSYLNKYNNENFPVSFWKVLIFPWLTYYLMSQLYRWRLVKRIMIEKKKISFFSFPDQEIYTNIRDTAEYHRLMRENNEYNYFHFKRILKHLKNKGSEILFIEKQYKSENKNKVRKENFFKKTKNFIFDLIDNTSLFFSKNNNIYIDDKLFKKKVYLKVNLHLKQFPNYFQNLFNYRIENNIFNKFQADIKKRTALSLNSNIKFEGNDDFIQYIDSSIRHDFPICFLEGFSDLKKSAEKIKMNPKLILSSLKHFHSEKFRFWVALKILKNNTKFFIATHGGGEGRKFEANIAMDEIISHKRITWTIPRNINEIQLPANKLINIKKKRKRYKYLSYVDNKGEFFPVRFHQKQNMQDFNLNNIKKFEIMLDKKIWRNLLYLPNNIYSWGTISEIRNILKKNFINKSNPLKKYLSKSKIVVCSYPQTAFFESILTGPTILLYQFNTDPYDKKFEKIINKLIKCKIAFSNPEDACSHINNVWDSVDKWWHSKDVKNAIEEFMQETALISNDSINMWTKYLKNEIKQQ